ncbi:beta-lactamase family protein [Nonomuraea sp. PA05]|uniref:serine hydrolase domain-containing protein n=1 Tax=Nonomuraea sp. PA05 TaxID=2604466 RepID=UPI0011D39E8B|nr:serine hydrolase domain-containing protein [Nonomuraea sp. PA05]TYB50112.1 beta-lactamase family protein [Nonomuraea sp. PA05]
MNVLQRRLQETADELVRSGAERGLQIAVYRHGEQVADVVAGLADPATGRPVTPGTPFHAFSAGKGLTAALVHVLAERGALDYDLPIAEVWPEFGAHGKGAATLRHAMTHATGVPGLPAGLTPADLCDWQRMCAVIADARPWWEPGTGSGYHSYTFGYIVGEVVRRVTGVPVARAFAEEVAGPLKVANELFLGVPRAELGRLARLEDAPEYAEQPATPTREEPEAPSREEPGAASGLGDPAAFVVAPRGVRPGAAFANRADVLSAAIPAAGQFTARAAARMYAALLAPVDGVRLISANRLRELSTPIVDDVDQVFGNRAVLSNGYAIGRLGTDPADTPTVFGWAGSGGSYACADTATGVAFAITKNRLAPDFSTAQRVGDVVAEAL